RLRRGRTRLCALRGWSVPRHPRQPPRRSGERRRPSRMSVASLCLLVALTAGQALAQPPDVAAIQAREARNADARTLAALERFRTALAARFGGDPRLTMLEISESEGEALVVRASGPPEHAIWQGARWIGTDGRQ